MFPRTDSANPVLNEAKQLL